MSKLLGSGLSLNARPAQLWHIASQVLWNSTCLRLSRLRSPQTMQLDPRYDDVVAEIHDYLRQRRDALLAAGIAPAAICLDPGIGFGKTHQHNLQLMQNAGRFLDLGCPILVGHSRKGFLGKLVEQATGREPTISDRDLATAATACSLAAQGIQIIRVHDVASTRLALVAFSATA